MEFLLELILEGSADLLGDRKMPFAVRIIAAVILIGFYGFLLGLLTYASITQRNWILGLLTLGVGGLLAAAFVIKIKKIKKHTDEK